ncbi:unnamed protein product [Caenorhabditis auriculariae]|uniref:Uncharacterized protein n=1 Tax=Caenorhabditis auriculariae TaxID=2777116 RepID=A0A8S1H273_9PELO|nr:unnamed protein product [Caenorhabditis auriculariae]
MIFQLKVTVCLIELTAAAVTDEDVAFLAWGLATLQSITPIVIQIFIERKILTEMIAFGYFEIAYFTVGILTFLRVIIYFVVASSKVGLPVNFIHHYMHLDYSFMHEHLETITVSNLFRDVAFLVILIFYEVVTIYHFTYVTLQCIRYKDARQRRSVSQRRHENDCSGSFWSQDGSNLCILDIPSLQTSASRSRNAGLWAYNHPNLIIPNQIRTKCSSEPNHSEPMEYSFRTN